VTHPVDGFDLKFTGRTSWKAKRSQSGVNIDIIPVTWTKGWRKDPKSEEIYQEVWFQNSGEMNERNSSNDPFIVAVAIAKDYSIFPHAFKQFQAIFEVVPTGVILSPQSIETRVLRRVKAE
jgi:hypothetical protein